MPTAGSGETPAPTGHPREPLSHYLGAAVGATVFAFTPKTTGGFDKQQTKALGAKETKEYLGRLDLAQHADGGVVRCPNDTIVEFVDAGGKMLGTIGFCQDNARFDAPDGSFGGIKAAAP